MHFIRRDRPHKVHFISKDSPYMVHFNRRDSPYWVHFTLVLLILWLYKTVLHQLTRTLTNYRTSCLYRGGCPSKNRASATPTMAATQVIRGYKQVLNNSSQWDYAVFSVQKFIILAESYIRNKLGLSWAKVGSNWNWNFVLLYSRFVD